MSNKLRLTALGAALAFGLVACGGGGAGSEIKAGGCNPENPLVAGNTAETCGGDVLDVLTAKLVHYNPETAEPENDIAESIETEDNKTFTVKIKKGYKFHDGTEVKAKNFVDAWNYTAFGPNGQQGGYFFEPVEGYDEVSDPKSKVKELSGLEVVDDHTFTIKTTEPVSNLPLRLGYTAFAPQPDSFFDDPEAFGYRFALKGTSGQTKFGLLRGSSRTTVAVKLGPAPETRPRDLLKVRTRSPFMGATLKAHIDANYADAAHSFEQFAIKADSSFVVNARVAIADITTRDGGPLLEVALWSRNLLDETYVYRRDPSNRNTLGDYGNFNNPRTFGIELRASY